MNNRLLTFRKTGRWLIAPEDALPISEPKAQPILHPFAVIDMTVRSSRTGEVVKQVDPRVWPEYGQGEQ
jgi:hypothetical protein